MTIQQLLGGNMRACICGGAALPVATFDFFHERGVMLLPGYGLTESSPVITVVDAHGSFVAARSARPFPASRCALPRTANCSPAART